MGKSISINKLCRCCMTSMDNADSVCPICGFDKTWYSAPREHLRLDSILTSRYMVGTSIAEDDFEISYIGWDLAKNEKVLIQEYYPKGLVMRERSDEVDVVIDENILTFEERVNQYLYTAQLLSKLNNLEGMSKVIDAFCENHTAYQVSEYPVGVSVQQYMERNGGRLECNEVLEIMQPVLETLQSVHERGILHKNVSTHNIIITEDGDVKLIGFLASSGIRGAIGQGPWTDVYDVCVTIYKLITGKMPERGINEEERGYSNDYDLIRPTSFGVDLPLNIEEALMKGLSPHQKERYKTATDLYERLYMKQVNQSAQSPIRTESTNQSKDGQCDMNDMNNMNNMNRPRMGQGQPRMNNPMGGQPRMNNPMGGTGQMNQRPNPMQPNSMQPNSAPRPGQDFMQNTQRMNTSQNVPPRAPSPAPRPQVAPPPMQATQPRPQVAPQQRQPMQSAAPRPQAAPPMQSAPRPQAAPPIKPAPQMNAPRGPVSQAPVGARPGVPQQTARPFTPAPPQAAAPQQNVMRPAAPQEPMGFGQPTKNRRAVALGKGPGSSVSMGGRESKISTSTIVTVLVCALIIGITAFKVIQTKFNNGDEQSKAGNNIQATAAAAVSDTKATKAAVATPLPEIKVYDVKEWKDPAIEKYAREVTGKKTGNISTSDLSNVTNIKLQTKEIANIEDLTHFQRIQTLNIKGNPITDLSPLANMKTIENLDLSYVKLAEADLSPLSSMTSLKKLNLSNCGIKDFSAVKNVPIVTGRPCDVDIKFYYHRTNNDYDDWNLWLWAGGDGKTYEFEPGDNYALSEVKLEDVLVDNVGVIVRKGTDWDTAEKDIDSNRYIYLQSNQNDIIYLSVHIYQGMNDFDITYE